MVIFMGGLAQRRWWSWQPWPSNWTYGWDHRTCLRTCNNMPCDSPDLSSTLPLRPQLLQTHPISLELSKRYHPILSLCVSVCEVGWLWWLKFVCLLIYFHGWWWWWWWLGVWLVVRTSVALCGRKEFRIIRDSLTGWVHLLLNWLAFRSAFQNTGPVAHRT